MKCHGYSIGEFMLTWIIYEIDMEGKSDVRENTGENTVAYAAAGCNRAHHCWGCWMCSGTRQETLKSRLRNRWLFL